MKITIRGKNAVVTDALKSYLEKKLTRLTRYFDSIQEAQVTVSTVGDNYSVSETLARSLPLLWLQWPGGVLR